MDQLAVGCSPHIEEDGQIPDPACQLKERQERGFSVGKGPDVQDVEQPE
jgi:hypothetical protein